jgi:hypothetical protein
LLLIKHGFFCCQRWNFYSPSVASHTFTATKKSASSFRLAPKPLREFGVRLASGFCKGSFYISHKTKNTLKRSKVIVSLLSGKCCKMLFLLYKPGYRMLLNHLFQRPYLFYFYWCIRSGKQHPANHNTIACV